ncbi:glycine receptor subunit alpha-3-like [Crassostrea virginica]|uniref:Glycine receptor subunit alpha-3-like n=1 Tax=Crassostrea virginica TaxID=6565 RepID=A0A8B8CZX3_CRAVI|nr:glycine receptor subunit alpha-3-like [Crassostrea virginica]
MALVEVLVCLFVCYGLAIAANSKALKDFSRTERLSLIEQKIGNSPPNFNDDFATKVECQLAIDSFDSINEVDMDFTVSIMLHLSWVDARFTTWTSGNDDILEFDSKRLDNIWTPDLFFPNEKSAFIHHVFMPNKMLRVYGGGKVSYTVRLSLTLSCPMDLRNYPFDKQICKIEMESFSYNEDNIILEWTADLANMSREPVEISDNIEMNQFRVVEKRTLKALNERRGAGNHSLLQAEFHLVRDIGYYMVQMYIPSMLIVMLSWISFWLNVNAVPGRISLGVLTVLTMTQQSSTVNATLPRVSYTKAIDIWMSMCLVFVFAALIEFAVANVLARKDSNKGFSFKKMFLLPTLSEKRKKRKGSGVLVDDRGLMRLDPEMDPTLVQKHRELSGLLHAMYLDVACRFLFPICFGIFNLVYWTVYTSDSFHNHG